MKNKTLTRFGLIRHAQTVWNRAKMIQGHSDSPLTDEGKTQAACWGRILEQFAWNRILASDSGRALETAERINRILKLSLTTDDRLREQDWGRWAGKTIAQIETEDPQFLAGQVGTGWDFCPPGGEDRKRVLKRSHKALIEAAAEWPGDNILVVAHEGVIKCLVYHLCGRQFLPTEPPIFKNYRLHWLIHNDGELRLEKLNALDLNFK